MPYSILRITSDDLEFMYSLLTVFGEVFDMDEHYIKHQPDKAYLHELLDNDSFIALCAVVNKQVVAGLTAYELKKYEQQRSEIYIYDLAVEKSYRRQGIATALIKEVQAIARDRKAYMVFVQADYGDEPAINLYEKLGTREEVIHFDISPQ